MKSKYIRKRGRYMLPCKNGGTKVKELIHLCLMDSDVFGSGKVRNNRRLYENFNRLKSDIIMSVASVRKRHGSKDFKEYVVFTDNKDLYISYPYENANDVIGIYSKKNIKRKVRIRTKYVVKLGSMPHNITSV